MGSDEDGPDEELLFSELWEDGSQREVVIESFQADCEVRVGRPAAFEMCSLRSEVSVSARRGERHFFSPVSLLMVNTPLTPSESDEVAF